MNEKEIKTHIQDLIKENERFIDLTKNGSGEPEIKNYAYYKGKQDAYNEILRYHPKKHTYEIPHFVRF